MICMSIRPKLSCSGSDSLATGLSSVLYGSNKSLSKRFSWGPHSVSENTKQTHVSIRAYAESKSLSTLRRDPTVFYTAFFTTGNKIARRTRREMGAVLSGGMLVFRSFRENGGRLGDVGTLNFRRPSDVRVTLNVDGTVDESNGGRPSLGSREKSRTNGIQRSKSGEVSAFNRHRPFFDASSLDKAAKCPLRSRIPNCDKNHAIAATFVFGRRVRIETHVRLVRR